MNTDRTHRGPQVPETAAATAQSHRFVEGGAAYATLAGLETPAPAARMPDGPLPAEPERIPVVVIGAGQAGLSAGYHLRRLGVPFVILDAEARVGDAWRRRWDSLRLFTPAKFDGLDGMPFPGDPDAFPTKNEMADYLEEYARRHELPVRSGVRVERLERRDGRFVISAGPRRIEAERVIVAMASYQRPRTPAFAAELDPGITQLHSADYRNPSQLRPGAALLVGAGNSGSEIAVELRRSGHDVFMSGRDVGALPFRIDGFAGRHLLVRLVLRGLFYRVLTVDTPVGRKARPKIVNQGGPLIRVKPRALDAMGVQRVPRVAGVTGGRPRLEDGRVLDVTNVIWCTGFHPGFSWIDLDIFDAHGEPRHYRGVVDETPGLYFVGLHFLYAMSSTMIHGVGRDAQYIAERVAEHSRARAA